MTTKPSCLPFWPRLSPHCLLWLNKPGPLLVLRMLWGFRAFACSDCSSWSTLFLILWMTCFYYSRVRSNVSSSAMFLFLSTSWESTISESLFITFPCFVPVTHLTLTAMALFDSCLPWQECHLHGGSDFVGLACKRLEVWLAHSYHLTHI